VEIVQDGDIIIWGKHFLDLKAVSQFKRKVFDVCDDHFEGPNQHYYRAALAMADVVTCNSEAMRFRIHQFGRTAIVIPDTYETERKIPSWGTGVLWFGHASNLEDLERVRDRIKQPLTILSNFPREDITAWSLAAQADALQKCAVVILPTGKSACKSANRLLESVMAGKYVVAEPLPAYEEFTDLWVGDLVEGLDAAFANPDRALKCVGWAQGKIIEKYSPKVIGGKWFDLLRAL
jgi:hypothetical protein